ncbi:cilia- and flagella-associated protein 100 isoform X1 [Gopherus evgoodei]|uniref:cilia- and flagella-associated protein 100 isoform X1 n=1 Tax=Gopherus evgoodei TaxID=1825980 RepID=UPI0011CEE1A8|nr:cilia- and flagella-associated protein 100 isoform X1 [Gopherus evgoodei]XP_030426217.1 cilia- and flagella-associated protein 100 isoform X1 [Gopherus evgoodei]XP_030426218.1 cilia- and flagella-associated protein 100 isoform X1 [Gopherus evgoodei]XP_030426219.1 cilia- and flagella-associated protein 100 isoform X1 [Gopherus evgoodei]XP_030426220.1 cilia- and flagella-associated protein 100 isoform X1 [Gopherus evgoodei]
MSVLSYTHSTGSQETSSSGAISKARTLPQQTVPTSGIPFTNSTVETKSPLSGDDDEFQLRKNPFKIPSDIDIFLLRDKERERAKAERERKKTLKVHEKMTYSTMMNAKQSGFKKELQKEEEAEDKELAAEAQRLKALQESISWKIAVTKDQQVEKETLHEYIDKKRQMFLLQYAVAIKRDEIQKLENLAAEEEAKLEKAEQYLEKDAAMFDEFLKENDKNSAQALKTAEKETKAKIEKIIEIRELTAQMMSIQSEISRFEDTLKEYKKYKNFLYQLSPKEWWEEYEKKQMKTKAMKMSSEVKEEKISVSPITPKGQDSTPRTRCGKLPYLGYTGRQSVDFSSGGPDLRAPSQITQRRESLRPGKSPSKQNLKSQQTRRQSIAALAMEEKASTTFSDNEDEDEEPELYFTDPQQLLHIFTELEEQNLSLIQNSQETEETLDELQHTLTTTRSKMDREIKQLKQLAATLKASIIKEEETAADLELKARVFSFGEYKADVQDKMLVSLNKKGDGGSIGRCIGENEANLGTLQMLTVIEHQLDDLLECLERVPQAKIEQAEKAKEKERRMRMRDEKVRQQRQLQEERLQRALARAQADIKKKTGRKLMFRSEPAPIKEKEDEDQGLIDQEKEEALYYFT